MKKDGNKIKAIIFDVGGVLLLNKASIHLLRKHRLLNVHSRMAHYFKIDLDQWFDSIDTPYAKSIDGKISKAKALSTISKNVNTTPKKLERLWVRAYKKHFKKNRKLFRISKKLKKKGYKLAILSDQWWLSKEALINKKLFKDFNPIIISCDEGIRKPNIKIYKLILKKLKLKPQETVFIDNQTWNIAPAKKIKMKTILFKDNKQTIGDLKKLGITI